LGETGQTPFLQMLDSGPESILDCLKKLLPVVRNSGIELILTKNQNLHKNWFLTCCGTDPKVLEAETLFIYMMQGSWNLVTYKLPY
jgi:hypothetical protein